MLENRGSEGVCEWVAVVKNVPSIQPLDFARHGVAGRPLQPLQNTQEQPETQWTDSRNGEYLARTCRPIAPQRPHKVHWSLQRRLCSTHFLVQLTPKIVVYCPSASCHWPGAGGLFFLFFLSLWWRRAASQEQGASMPNWAHLEGFGQSWTFIISHHQSTNELRIVAS